MGHWVHCKQTLKSDCIPFQQPKIIKHHASYNTQHTNSPLFHSECDTLYWYYMYIIGLWTIWKASFKLQPVFSWYWELWLHIMEFIPAKDKFALFPFLPLLLSPVNCHVAESERRTRGEERARGESGKVQFKQAPLITADWQWQQQAVCDLRCPTLNVR